MKLFGSIFKKDNKNIEIFEKFGLKEWWEDSFNSSEREIIISESSIILDYQYSSEISISRTLYLLAGYVNTKNTYKHKNLTLRILEKADELSDDPLELFPIYSQMIKIYFNRRNDREEYLSKTIKFCNKQIDLADDFKKELIKNSKYINDLKKLNNPGYGKLAIIERERGNKERAEKLIAEAEDKGWNISVPV